MRPNIVKITQALLAAATVSTIAAGGVWVAFPAHADPAEAARPVSNVSLTWGVNPESSGGAYFGGCNFLSAGAAGNTESARLWQEADGFFSASDGNVEILKPDATGQLMQPTWSTKCQNRYGTNINGRIAGLEFEVAGATPTVQPTYTESQVHFSSGRGWVDPDSDSAAITWEGSFTIAYYGGMTYWTITNPILEIKDGVGELRGTASGFGTDMDDLSIWKELEATDIHVADIDGVEISDDGITIDPVFLGVTIPDDIAGRNPQAPRTDENASWWGAFPDSWLRFNILTGQDSYWYTTAGGQGSIQPRKVASPISIDWSNTPALRLSTPTAAPGDSLQLQGVNLSDVEDYVVELRRGDSSWELAAGTNGGAEQLNVEVTLPEDLESGEYGIYLVAEGNDIASSLLTVGVDPGQPVITDISDVSARGLKLSWREPANAAETRVQGYTVTVTNRHDSADSTAQDVAATTVELNDLKPQTMYDIAVSARGAFGTGPAAIVTVRTSDGETSPITPPGEDQLEGNLDNVTLRWGMNQESNSKSFWGSCNFLSAGKAADNGGAKPWPETLYSAADGNVRIEKPDASGNWVNASWQTRCLDAQGAPVTLQPITSNTQSQVVIGDGKGEITGDGSVTVQWQGSWTVAYYDGLTYWSVSDPRLTLDADGNGTLTATASGFGADMDDLSKWATLPEKEIVLADLRNVDVRSARTSGGFTHTPEYLGVAVNDAGGRSPQAPRSQENADYWGSFPQSFVDYQVLTGQSSYWYTSNGQRDRAKPASPLTVAFTEEYTVPTAVPVTSSGGGATGLRALPTGNSAKTSTPAASAQKTKAASADGPAGASSMPVDDQTTSVKNVAGQVAAGSAVLAASGGLVAAGAWALRRRLGLDPAAVLDS